MMPTAGYFNPAGFGLLKKMEFSGGLDYSNFSNNAALNSNRSLLDNLLITLQVLLHLIELASHSLSLLSRKSCIWFFLSEYKRFK